LESGRFPRGMTYLPSGFSDRALARFGRGELEPLLAELRALDRPYERAGIDRDLAIAGDLALLGMPRDTRILDVGCSVGTIALLLSEVGYPVTGINSDVVARVQDWQDDSILASARAAIERPRCRLLRADLRDHLEDPESWYDVALLLGVLHHWLAGYGYSGEEQMDRGEIRRTLERLCERVRSYLYVEVPIADGALYDPASAARLIAAWESGRVSYIVFTEGIGQDQLSVGPVLQDWIGHNADLVASFGNYRIYQPKVLRNEPGGV